MNKTNNDLEFYDTNFWIGENPLSKKLSVNDDKLAEIIDERKKTYKIK